MAARQLLTSHSESLKQHPWPEEPVYARFSHWKHARYGRIVYQGIAGYSFVDEKGNSYQCSPGYQPVEIRLARTQEEWSCYQE